MTQQPRHTELTADAFMEWAAEQRTGRFELSGGQIVAMAPERTMHARVKGEIWANVWHSEEIGKPNHIARIDPQTGSLVGWVDLQGISPEDVYRHL